MSTQDKADYQWSDEDQSTFVDDLKEDLEDHCDRPMTVGQAIKVLEPLLNLGTFDLDARITFAEIQIVGVEA